MTSNQINYWKNVEAERSNRANEALSHERNLAAAKSADAALMQAQTAKSLSTSQKVSNYARAAESAGKAVQSVSTSAANIAKTFLLG